MINYYEILGIAPDATDEDITTAYFNKTKEYHPDALLGTVLTEEEKNFYIKRFKLASEAYEVLKDPDARKKYDSYMHEEKIQQNGNSLLQAYREVKADEAKYPFRERHQNFHILVEDSFGERNSIPKDIMYHFAQGTIHFFGEALYQIRKLGYISKDPLPKYIIRNRSLIGAIILGGALFTLPGKISKNETMETPAPVETVSPVQEESKTLWRVHIIEAGDTLSEFAYDSRTSMEEIQRVNYYDNTTIYRNEIIRIPYFVPAEELRYYTMKINPGSLSLEDICRKYETDIDTLIELNNGNIRSIDGNYVLFSEEIVVPHFISREELNQLKGENQHVK